ncbi:MAG: nicotinamide-nucleotide amidohydrolase family protein [Deltaproteobacteria bacterium]|nr:nicotinamide-nucleotide amidohydrolase family protein [Deltaproteobacteria bacterium]
MTAKQASGAFKATALGASLKRNNLTLAAAESCTGGFLSHLFTNIPGSSDWFKGGVVAYDNAVKTKILGVKASTIERHGAVSEETAVEMARGIKKKLDADVGAAITGIAGPGKGIPGKPVGTVYICVASARKKTVKKFQFKGARVKIKTLSALKAVEMLERFVLRGALK